MLETEAIKQVKGKLRNRKLDYFIKIIDLIFSKQSDASHKMSDIKDEIYFHLNLHILSGEYMFWLPYVDDEHELDNGHDLFKNLEEIIATSDNISNGSLPRALSKLDWLLRHIQVEIALDKEYELIGWESKNDIEGSSNMEKLFFHNLKTAHSDHFYMSFGIGDLITVLLDTHRPLNNIRTDVWKRYQNDIKDGKSPSLSDDYYIALVSVEKINFLIRKALLCFAESNMERSYSGNTKRELARFDNGYKKIIENDDHELYYLYSKLEKSKQYYGMPPHNLPGVLYDSITTKIDDPSGEMTLDEYHHAIKFYRDEKPSLYRLNNLQKKLKGQIELIKKKSLSEFDKRAYKMALGFIANARLRAFLSKKPSFEKVNQFYEKEDPYMDGEFSLHFFYSHRYICEYFAETREEWIGKVDVFELWKHYEKWGDELRLWKQRLKDAMQYNFAPYYLPFEECRLKMEFDADAPKYIDNKPEKGTELKIRGEELKIFIASSYIQPFDEMHQNEKRYKNKGLYTKVMTEAIRRSTESVKDETELRIREMQNNAIQVLGIFTAVVTFMAGSIGAIKFADSIKNAVLFLSIYGLSLLLFVFALAFLLEKVRLQSSLASKKITKKSKLALRLGVIVMLSILVAIIVIGIFVSLIINRHRI